VKTKGGDPVGDVNVFALPVVDGETDYEHAYGTYGNDSGGYSIAGLPAGEYKIQFAQNFGFFDEFFNDKATDALADTQTVLLGASVDLGTTVLEQSAEITGRVTDVSGTGLGDILVEAFPVVEGVVAEDGLDYAYTEGDGTYNLRDLHAGTYRLKVQDGLHRYQDNFITEVTVEGGESPDIEPIVLTLAPVVAPVVPPAPYTPAPAPVVKKSASVNVSAKGAKKKATLTITVKASGVTPTGKVTIKLGSKTLKTVTLKGGKAKVTLTKQKKGKRTYKVIYSGDSRVRTKTVTTSKVTIK
jgi:hypothetical protein